MGGGMPGSVSSGGVRAGRTRPVKKQAKSLTGGLEELLAAREGVVGAAVQEALQEQGVLTTHLDAVPWGLACDVIRLARHRSEGPSRTRLDDYRQARLQRQGQRTSNGQPRWTN